MKLTNDAYLITLRAGRGVEHYYRDGPDWIKQSTTGRKFKATAEQVLNHLLPALAGIKPQVSARVDHVEVSDATARTLERLRR
jgi:deoxyribose-phosphate aldolase